MENKALVKGLITPSQYFDNLKNAKKVITTEALKESYEVILKLAEKYNKLGQVRSLQKLCFLANTLIKEEKLIEMGISTYIYKDTIEDYIENVADKTVKIIELSRYMREVPDELVDTVTSTRDIFDEFYVVFTDYTGSEERKVEKERRDKDPILFGVFKNDGCVADRFYFLGDWVDEYCDLTLDKMVEEYKKNTDKSLALTTTIPKTSEELVDILKQYDIDKNNRVIMSNYLYDAKSLSADQFEIDNFKRTQEAKVKPSFIDKIRNALKKKRND